jgi:hypothetical protein
VITVFRAPRKESSFMRLVTILAAVAIALGTAAAPALAQTGGTAADHGMTAEDHAAMGEGTSTTGGAAADHGMTPEEHAAMMGEGSGRTAAPTDDGRTRNVTPDERFDGKDPNAFQAHDDRANPHGGAAGHDHGAATGPASHGHSAHGTTGHGDTATTTERPAGMLIGGFLAVNALVLLGAGILRRRGVGAKRRAARARVRAAAGRPSHV